MRRFMKTVNVLGRKLFIHLVSYNDSDMHTAMCSGIPFKEPQYLFMDYDAEYMPQEWEWITNEYELRRALVIESSPQKFWYLSFSPLPVGIISEIMFNSQCDKNHAQYLLKEGCVAIRLSSKKVEGYPRIVKEIVNMKGTNFYNWDMERTFRHILEKGVDKI
jgi:hypothetical protein